jgi:FlaA1/EpsC-like NDP-sugar epimerase
MKNKLGNGLLNIYGSLSRSRKQIILGVTDVIIFVTSITLAISLRFKLNPEVQQLFWENSWKLALFVALKLLVFRLVGVYKPILRYTGLEFLSTIAQGTFISSSIWLFCSLQQGLMPFSRGILVVDGLLTLVLIVIARLSIRQFVQSLHQNVLDGRPSETVIIYGAGVAGVQLAHSIRHEPGYRLVAFIDDNQELHKRLLEGSWSLSLKQKRQTLLF